MEKEKRQEKSWLELIGLGIVAVIGFGVHIYHYYTQEEVLLQYKNIEEAGRAEKRRFNKTDEEASDGIAFYL